MGFASKWLSSALHMSGSHFSRRCGWSLRKGQDKLRNYLSALPGLLEPAPHHSPQLHLTLYHPTHHVPTTSASISSMDEPETQWICMHYFLFLECSPPFFLWPTSVDSSSLNLKCYLLREVSLIPPTYTLLQLSLGWEVLVYIPKDPTSVFLNIYHSCTWKALSVLLCLMPVSLIWL